MRKLRSDCTVGTAEKKLGLPGKGKTTMAEYKVIFCSVEVSNNKQVIAKLAMLVRNLEPKQIHIHCWTQEDLPEEWEKIESLSIGGTDENLIKELPDILKYFSGIYFWARKMSFTIESFI